MDSVFIVVMVIAILILLLSLLSCKNNANVLENYWTYYTPNCRQGSGRFRDNFMRHLTQPRWMAKDETVPSYTPYYDYESFYPSGILTHTSKPTLTLTMFSEKHLSGGGVVFKYKYGIIHFSNVHRRGALVPFQTDKDLSTGDVISIPGYPGEFHVTLYERGPGVADLPYPYTFQPNII